MAEKNSYKEVQDYKDRLGINHNITRLKAAFEKAWEIRNFEIEKFWQRSAYFWGFIALVFGGYIGVLTGKSRDIVENSYIDLYLILLGIIFSFGWLLVIRGSKRWQDNWEAHIDKLEDEITGPLYKTVYYKRKCYYSVSKISEALAWVVISVWCILFIRYVFDNCIMFRDMLMYFPQYEKIFFVVLPIITAAFVCVYVLFVKCQTANGKIKADFEKEHGVFLERVSGE